MADRTGRFTDRADDYVRGRPGYPAELFDALIELAAPPPGGAIADLGAGTGISAEPFLARGFTVFAVEPNASMREAARARLGNRPGFRAVDGTAEATGLPDASVDLVVAFQAFHWFDGERARREALRILRPAGAAALVWNARRAAGSPFLADYEALLQRFGTDYREIGHRGIEPERLRRFFGGGFAERRFVHHQDLDAASLRARLLSSSYVPAAGVPGHEAMLDELARISARHEQDGRVRIVYDAELFVGALARSAGSAG